jgi:hypothetical protein
LEELHLKGLILQLIVWHDILRLEGSGAEGDAVRVQGELSLLMRKTDIGAVNCGGHRNGRVLVVFFRIEGRVMIRKISGIGANTTSTKASKKRSTRVLGSGRHEKKAIDKKRKKEEEKHNHK